MDELAVSVCVGGHGILVPDLLVTPQVSHQRKLLIVANGSYGERMAAMAEALQQVLLASLSVTSATVTELEGTVGRLIASGAVAVIALRQTELCRQRVALDRRGEGRPR